MRTTTIIVLLLVGLALAAILLRRFAAPVETVTARENAYDGLRTQALTLRRSDTGVAAADGEIWAVLMELPISGATATVVAIADGTASIYLSSGGGFIGGGRHESVRQAAEALVSAARAASGAFAPVSSFPAPAPGQVRFYARVDDGVHAAEAGERTLQSGQHPLSPVYDAGQGVITAYRLIDR